MSYTYTKPRNARSRTIAMLVHSLYRENGQCTMFCEVLSDVRPATALHNVTLAGGGHYYVILVRVAPVRILSPVSVSLYINTTRVTE